MKQPKYKLGDRVIYDWGDSTDEGVIDAIKYTDDTLHAWYPFWYEVDLGYTWVGACEEDLTSVP